MYTPEAIQTFNSWKNHFDELHKLYTMASVRYNSRSNLMKFFIILTTSLSTSLAIGGISNTQVINILLYVIICFNAANILLTGIDSKVKWSKMAQDYKKQTNNYLKIILKIEKSLILQNIDIETILNEIINDYQKIEENGIVLPQDLYLKNEEKRKSFMDSGLNFRSIVIEN